MFKDFFQKLFLGILFTTLGFMVLGIAFLFGLFFYYYIKLTLIVLLFLIVSFVVGLIQWNRGWRC